MNRRSFLRRSVAATLASTAPLSSLTNIALGAAEGRPKRLVVVMLRGAVDGLSVVVPYAEPAYYDSRPSIAIRRPGAEDGALPLDNRFGLHPALASLLPLWNAKKLAFIHAAGSPDPTRSHFDAQLFIENGTPGRSLTADGWMNRLLAVLPGPHGPAEAIALGATLPTILRGHMPVANLPLGPQAARSMPIDRPEIAAGFDRLYSADDHLGTAYRQGRTARAELLSDFSAEQATTEQQAADNGAPLSNGFPAEAGRLARLIGQDAGIRLCFTSLGGWDTHVRQGNHKGQLADRLRPLGDGLAALARSLGGDWTDTVVVVLSEFGRTAHENGNGGTDHGHGNVIWVMGGSVAGGRVYGDWPGLSTSQLHDGRDLAITTDYRDVLATVLERHLRLADRQLDPVFPGLPPGSARLGSLLAG